MPVPPPAIEIQNLTRRFRNVIALDNLSLTVERGIIFCLLGPDGAGKTTLMRILAGVIDAGEGTARVAGFDLRRESELVKARIGYMSQRFSLYPDLTVEENLNFFADLNGVPREERDRKKEELLEFARLLPFRRRPAGQLSGGMKQKLALASTLIHTPDVLLLDEPSTGVDPVSRRELWKILYSLIPGITIFVSTPYMDEAERSSRVGFIHRGRLMLSEEPSRIKEKYSRLEDMFVELMTKNN